MKIFSAYFLILIFSVQALAFPFPMIVHEVLPSKVVTLASTTIQHLASLAALLRLKDWFGALSPPSFDFWRSVKELGEKAGEKANDKILKDAAVEYSSAADKINEFKESMRWVVTVAEEMNTIREDVDLEEFQNRFGVELSRALEELKKEFSEPLPEDQTERYQQQAYMIARALDKIEDALVNVWRFWKISEAGVRVKFGKIKPPLKHLLLIIAKLVNNHPNLLVTLLLSGAIMIMPETLILRPILSFLGFGLEGPVKGSFAAVAQRFFFGAVVQRGGWFSMLQRAGMKYPVNFVSKIFHDIISFFCWW